MAERYNENGEKLGPYSGQSLHALVAFGTASKAVCEAMEQCQSPSEVAQHVRVACAAGKLLIGQMTADCAMNTEQVIKDGIAAREWWIIGIAAAIFLGILLTG